MLFVHSRSLLLTFIAYFLLLSLLTPAISLAAITGSYDNSGAGPSGEEGVGQLSDEALTPPGEPNDEIENKKGDDPCNIEEPIKKSDSEDCKTLKRNKTSINDTIENAKTLGIEIDEEQTRADIQAGKIHTGQIVTKDGNVQTISPGTYVNSLSGGGSLEDLNPSNWDWYNEASQVKTGSVGRVLEEVSGSVGSTGQGISGSLSPSTGNIDTSELLANRQAEIENTLNDLSTAQTENINARNELQLIPDQSAVQQDQIQVDQAIANIEQNQQKFTQLKNTVSQLAEAQATLNSQKGQMSPSGFAIAQAQINEALNAIDGSYSTSQTSLGNKIYNSNPNQIEIANQVANKAIQTVNTVTGQSTSGNDRFNYLDPTSLIGNGGDTPYGEDTLGKFVQLSPSQEAALFGSKQDAKTMTDILIGENTDLAKKISDAVKNGTPLSPEEIQEAIGITYGICDNRAIKGNGCFNSDGSVNGNVYSSFIGPEGSQEVDRRKAELARTGSLTEVETNVQKFFEDNMEKGLLGSGFTGYTQTDGNGNVSAISTVDDLIAQPLATHSYSPRNNFIPSWYDNIVPGTLTDVGEHKIATLYTGDMSRIEFDVMKKYDVTHTDLPSNITEINTKQQGYTPDFIAGTLGDSPQLDFGSTPTNVPSSNYQSFTLAELGINDINSIPDIPAPLGGYGSYAGVDDVKQTLAAFSNKTPQEYTVGVVAADNLGIDVFTANNNEKAEVVDSVAKLTQTLGPKRHKESDVKVNGFAIDEQVQIAVTQYNLEHDRNLSVNNFSEMGAHGSHRHREVDDLTKGQGCACAVDITIRDENGNYIYVKGNEDLYSEIAKNFTQNTGGVANYSTTYMNGRNVHFDVANINPVRSGVTPAYTPYARSNEKSFGQEIRNNLNIDFEYGVSEDGRQYVKNYVVKPKSDTSKPSVQIANNQLNNTSPNNNQSNPTQNTNTTPSGTLNPLVEAVAPLVRLATPNNDPGVNQFLTMSSTMVDVFGQVVGLLNSFDNNNTNTQNYPAPTNTWLDGQLAYDSFDTRVPTDSGSISAEEQSIISNLLSQSGVLGNDGISQLFQTLNANFNQLLSNTNRNTDTNQRPVETITNNTEPRIVPVTVTVNEQTRQINLSRDDVLQMLLEVQQAEGEISEVNEFYLYTEENPLVLGQNNEVLYSNGLYAPATEDFPINEGLDNPTYVYLIRHIDENGNLVQENTTDNLPNVSFLEKVSQEIFGNKGLYAFEDVKEATYELVDPNENVPKDEYNRYVIHLTDGTSRYVEVPEYTNVATLREQFFASGYRGNVITLMNIAREIPSAEVEQKQTIIKAVIDRVAGAFEELVNTFTTSPDEGEQFTDLYIEQEATNIPRLSIDRLQGLYIYPEANTSCVNDGYIFDAFVKDSNNSDIVTIITEERCGTGGAVDMIIDAATVLQGSYGFAELDGKQLLSRSYINLDPINAVPGVTTINASELPQPDTDTTVIIDEPETNPEDLNEDANPSFIPNTSNTVSFEVKAVNSLGEVVHDWTTSDITITPDDEIFFRWNSSDYSQCLPFLNDSGYYALSRGDETQFLTGNTETENFDISEQNKAYRIECGGQNNGEFGVDIQQINISIQ